MNDPTGLRNRADCPSHWYESPKCGMPKQEAGQHPCEDPVLKSPDIGQWDVRPCYYPASDRTWQEAPKGDEHAVSHSLNAAVAATSIGLPWEWTSGRHHCGSQTVT